MAEAGSAYAELLTDTAATTTYVDGAAIAAGDFVAGKTYLILAMGMFGSSSATVGADVQLLHGSTPFTDDPVKIDFDSTSARAPVCFMHKFTQPGTAEGIKLQHRSVGGGASTVTSYTSIVLAICLDDIGTENTDWYFTEDTSDLTTSTTPASEASVTVAANGTDDWLVIANVSIDADTGSASQRFSIYDGTTEEPSAFVEGEQAAAEFGWMLARTFTPANGNTTYACRFTAESTADEVRSSRIFAVNLSKFAEHAFQYTSAGTTPATTPSFTTIAGVDPTPTVTGNWVILGSHIFAAGAVGDDHDFRIQVNPDGGGLVSRPNENVRHNNRFDASDDYPIVLFTRVTLNSGAAREINHEASNVSGTAQVKHRHVVAFSLELAAAAAAKSPTFRRRSQAHLLAR